MSQLLTSILFGTMMMGFISMMVYSLDVEECVTNNETLEKQILCKEGITTIQQITMYAWVAFLVPIPIALVAKYDRKKSTQQNQTNGRINNG